MRDNGQDGTGTFHHVTENVEARNAHADALVPPETLRCKGTTSALSVVAARLIEDAGWEDCNDDRYDFLISCLRTGTVQEFRLVFVVGRPLIFALLDIFYRNRRNAGDPTPKNYRALSRRQVGILRMIARGMSNKCIARSLGIAPETVKTHVKGILSKLRARTRAQAVARAEAIGQL